MPARREQQNALREGRGIDACRRRGVKAAGPARCRAMAATDSPRSRRRGRWSGCRRQRRRGGRRMVRARAARSPRRVPFHHAKCVLERGKLRHGGSRTAVIPRPHGRPRARASARPPDRSSRRRPRDTMPLHSRLQPGSGWLALTWAAARAPAEGQCGSWGTSIWLLRARTRLACGSRSVRQDPAGRRPGVDPAPPRLRPARLAADPDLLHLAHQLSMLDLDARIWNAGLAAGSP